ncbi:MAG TPA: peptidylprolyl isomerase [Oscillatoriaceae cyanobacterium M33_DOE_052]|uniref:peptidylprolyl isomerase n=1 Tax=Planktothricoides sp. SpSt-374 TaxID=2282167 RepID=A0A7C3VMN8_9CYAN|nr:peptidylprolyl isomerase [Oscillatoriaceae cyanobacterium M33_DOE_052]
MVNLAKAAITLEEIASFLKKELRLKEVYQHILHRQIIEKAAAERGLTVTEAEIQAEGDNFRFQNRLEKAADTLGWLADQMISVEEWEEGIRDRLLAQKLSDALFAKEVEKFFAQNRLDFDQILLYQIVVPYERVAKELYYQIEEQEISFYEAAHLYDLDDRRRQNCGYEGKIYRSSLKPEVAAAIFSAKLGEIVGPLKTEQGYHLFLVEDFIGAELTKEVQREIKERMFQQWLASELNYFLHSLN